jgi:uncharacterized membrane protein
MSAGRLRAPWARIAVGLALALGLFFRFDNLAGKEFWEDEVLGRVHALGYTEAQIVEASPKLTHAADLQRYLDVGPQAGSLPPVADTVRSLAVEDPQHPPVYYVLAHVWTQAFGGRMTAVRALPAIFGVLAIPALWLLAFELFGSLEAAWVAAALLAISPFFVLYAQEAREYSLWTVLVVLDGWLLLRALRSPSLAWWCAYAALAALSLYVDPLSALVLAGFACYAFAAAGFRFPRRVVACAVATAVALAAFVPWVRVMQTSRGLERGMAGIVSQKLGLATIATIALRNLRLTFFDFGLFRLGPVSSGMLNAVLTLVMVAATAYAFVRLVRGNAFGTWGFVVVGLCAPMALLLLDDLFVRGRFVYQMRYFTPAIAGVVLALADLARPRETGRVPSPVRRPAWSALVLTALVLGGTLSCAISARATTWWNKDYEQSYAVARAINAAHDPLLLSDYDPDSVLALAYNLDPGVAVDVHLRCAQCSLAAAPGATGLADAPAAQRGMVFVLDDAPPDARGAGAAGVTYVDPHPFPAHAEPLAMFRSIGSAAAR